MANLTDEELDEIVKQSLPGYKVSPKSQVAKQVREVDSARRSADASSTDSRRAEVLRRRYLGTDAEAVDDEDDLAEDSAPLAAAKDYVPENDLADDDDDEHKKPGPTPADQPETAADPLDRGTRAKAAVISKKGKKVIGQQG